MRRCHQRDVIHPRECHDSSSTLTERDFPGSQRLDTASAPKVGRARSHLHSSEISLSIGHRPTAGARRGIPQAGGMLFSPNPRAWPRCLGSTQNERKPACLPRGRTSRRRCCDSGKNSQPARKAGQRARDGGSARYRARRRPVEGTLRIERPPRATRGKADGAASRGLRTETNERIVRRCRRWESNPHSLAGTGF